MDSPRFVPGFSPEPPTGDALWALYRGDELLMKRAERGARLLRTDEVRELGIEVGRAHHLGALGGLPCLAAELTAGANGAAGYSFGGLRVAYGWLDAAEFDVAGRAFQIQYWDRNHRFCPGCGGPIALKSTERAKRCEACKRDFYPPVVPAMIVRVSKGDEILMTRQSRFPKGMYGLVAGFMEPGETLEECVEREVLEEAGLRVKNVRYFGSQPWPFPHQVMLAFTAEWASGDVVVDTTELEEARWFERAAMPMLPPPISIARKLIDDWLGPAAD
jgi:NAD+ diphosphatase